VINDGASSTVAASTQSEQIVPQQILSGQEPNIDDGLKASGVNEDDLDKEFFQNNNSKLKKVKLNKGEKRALKFLMRREMEAGRELDISSMGDIKQYLAK